MRAATRAGARQADASFRTGGEGVSLSVMAVLRGSQWDSDSDRESSVEEVEGVEERGEEQGAGEGRRQSALTTC